MNVDPVQAISAGIERQTPEKKVYIAPAQHRFASGNAPKPEVTNAENDPTPPLIPEHEVKVQLDTSADDMMVYQVLDKKSGALVVQVPSAEEIRNIQQTQELLRRIAARGRAPAADAAAPPVVKGEE
jgi:hypothetical protein